MVLPTDLELIRDRTTEDEVLVPDDKIERYLELNAGDWRLAAADILEYLTRDDIYEQYSRGQIRVAKPLLHERARELRAEAIAYSGVPITMGSMVRTDFNRDEVNTDEYIANHPPYQMGLGVKRFAAGRDQG